MSNENVVYKVRAGGAEYGADDKASAEALAELLGGVVFTTSRKEALAHVRTITAQPDYPPVLAGMVSNIKDSMVIELTDNSMLADSCWRIIAQYDSRGKGWYVELKNLADGPVVYNQTTGERYTSIAHARWENGKSCAVKYLANGIKADDKFSKTKPEIVKDTDRKVQAAKDAALEATASAK